jgi:RNA polymerase sigma-70 factor (ECF subfamily)
MVVLRQIRNVSIVVEEQLLQECARHDRKAQYRLYAASYSFMMSICIRYTSSRDDAEDLLNRSFLKVLDNIGRYRPEVPFALWVRRITINTIIDEYRRRKKERENLDYVDFGDSPSEYDATVVNSYLDKINAEEIQGLIDQLPPMSRRVFNLFAVDGYGHKEIGELLGMSEGTSKWHLNFARNRLKEQISNLRPSPKTVNTVAS